MTAHCPDLDELLMDFDEKNDAAAILAMRDWERGKGPSKEYLKARKAMKKAWLKYWDAIGVEPAIS